MKKSETLQGIISTNRKGMGFMKNPHNTEKDILIEIGTLNTALNGDTVEIKLGKINQYKQQLAEVVRVIERKRDMFVCVIDSKEGVLTAYPEDKKAYASIRLSPADIVKVSIGDKVYVKMEEWTNPKENPKGTIVRILGKKGDNNVEMESIVLERGFEVGFPAGVEKEADEIDKNKVADIASEIPKRKDFRGTLTFTIDPFDAKDFDDAISFKDLGAGKYEIGVHIADVSHYVIEGSALDKEALKRGCSIYLVDRTIPMLPEVLSNDVCSLNPHEDKLTFSAWFVMDDKGHIHERGFGKTIINSDHRFTYEDAQEVLNAKSGKYFEELDKLNTIAKILQKDKFSKGAIEFETEEIKFKLDENGKPIGVYKKERLDTHKLVEEYMLLANREVAKHIFDSIKKKSKKDTGSIYRIHDLPDKDRMMELAIFVKALGYNLPTKEGKVTAHDIKALLKQIAGTPHETLISTAVIRSMQKAVYSTKNIGHFGLAFEYYTHFTSPIRRYPDLLIQRILQRHLHNEPFGDTEIVNFQSIAEKSTAREIDAAGAERESKKLKQVEYMADKIGQTFDGTISGVTEYGIYVEEKETKSEGMINIRNIGTDFYEFDKKTYSIVGQKTKKRFTLGDPIKFKVAGADLDKKILDFVPA
ncbi:MAG: ribonuclease [Patescibacteria group bacterium]|nr:ribonuclease [Patescibacteria group bacterium]